MRLIFNMKRAALLLPLIISISATAQQQQVLINFQSGSVITLAPGADASDMAIGDFDHNGFKDIAVTQRALNSVAVYQQSLGAFTTSPLLLATGNAPTSLVAVDLNNTPLDKNDLLVVSPSDGNFYAYVGSNGQPSVFSRFATIPFGTNFPASNSRLMAGYYNATRYVDVIYTYDAPIGEGIGMLSHRGGTSFNSRSSYKVMQVPSSISVSDIDGDGNQDYLVTIPQQSLAHLYYGSSSGFPDNPLTLTTGGNQPACIAAADVNGDSRTDIIVADADNNTISVLLNTGLGQFNPPVVFQQMAPARQIILADLNNDQLIDMATLNADNTLRLYRNTGQSGPNRFELVQTVVTDPNPQLLKLENMDYDAYPELAVFCPSASKVHIYNNASGLILANQTSKLSEIEVYPNPASTSITLEIPANVGDQGSITLLDALGRVVKQGTLPTASHRLELSVGDLARGVYSLHVQTIAGTAIRRIILR
jgi:hypothetical protein